LGKIVKILSVIILILLLYFLLFSCKNRDGIERGKTSDDPLKITIYHQKLVVGSDTNYPPFEYKKDGEIIGFDIDIAKEIAARLELELEIIPIVWDFTYQLPEDVKVDMIISAVSADKVKEKLADFSDPYYVMEYMLIIISDAKLKIKEDLKGKKVGMLASAESNLPAKYLNYFVIEKYDSKLLILEALKNKNIEGALISVPVGKNIIEENKGIYRVLETVKSERELNIVFPKGSPLRGDVNRILAEIKEDGTYQDIYNKWFSY